MQELFSSINWELLLPIFIIQGILLLIAIIDWIKNPEDIRGNRWVWFVVIVFVNIVGPILYFIFGRRRNQ